jgi:hypothetical protein
VVISALGLIIPRRDCFPFSLDFSLLSEDPVNVIGNSPSRDTMEVGTDLSCDARGLIIVRSYQQLNQPLDRISDSRPTVNRNHSRVCTESRGDIGIKRRIEFGLRGGAKTEINETLRISPQPKAQPLKCNQPADDVGCSKYLSELAL